MIHWIRSLLRWQALRHGRFSGLFRRICQPGPLEWAEHLRARRTFYSMGQGVMIVPSTVFTDPGMTRLGSNILLAGCHLVNHDGSIAVLNRAYNERLEAVGAIDVKDNVFIGYNALVLAVNGPLTIGPNAIIAAGSVVTKSVPEGMIVAGVPAKEIGRTIDYVEKLKARTGDLPWAPLIAARAGSVDPAVEPELVRLRQIEFFGAPRPGAGGAT